MDENQQAKGHKSQELLRFQATAPCRYCDAPDLVPVSPAELARIADYVGVAKEEALREYCRHEPLYRYYPRVTLKAGEDGRCPFATEGGCALRGVRPRACQLFPLEATPAVIREKGRKERYEMGYHLAQGIPDAGDAYTPEPWETRDGTPFCEAEALEDFIFRCEVLPLCAAMDQKVAHNSLLRELFRRLYSINLGVLYLNYSDDEPFDETYRRNRSMVYALLAAYV